MGTRRNMVHRKSYRLHTALDVHDRTAKSLKHRLEQAQKKLKNAQEGNDPNDLEKCHALVQTFERKLSQLYDVMNRTTKNLATIEPLVRAKLKKAA